MLDQATYTPRLKALYASSIRAATIRTAMIFTMWG